MEKVNTANAAAQLEKRIYTVDEIQDILGVSKVSAYTLVKSGVFHIVKVGGQYRVSKRALMLGSKDRTVTANDKENYVGS